MHMQFKMMVRSVTVLALMASSQAVTPISVLGGATAKADGCDVETANGPIGPNGEAFANVTTFCGDRQANRYAAIAFSESTLSSGSSWGWNTQVEAERHALVACSESASDCKTLVWSTDCAALAVSDNDDGQFWGWGYNPFPDFAESTAVNSCKNEGGTNCKVVAYPCSGD